MDNAKLKARMSGKVQGLQPAAAEIVPDTAMAPVDSSYIALTNNALDIIRANLKSQPLSLDLFDIVKSPSGGATVFSVPGLARFRVNTYQQRGSMAAVVRVVAFGIPDWKEMGIRGMDREYLYSGDQHVLCSCRGLGYEICGPVHHKRRFRGRYECLLPWIHQ